MKLRITKTAASVSCVLGVLTLMMGSVGVNAKLSPSTGTIEGRAPTVTSGKLVLLSPDNAEITYNALVPSGYVPNEFIGSTALLNIPVDEDGDIGLSTVMDDIQAQYLFMKDGVPLTPAQMSQPLGVTAPGGVVTAKIIAPVIVSSVTGVPNTSTTAAMESDTYTFRIDSTVVVSAGGVTMSMAASFPNMGFTGAEFTFLMNGVDTNANSTYTYSSDKSWYSVDAGGKVLFTRMPDVGDNVAAVTITDKSGVRPPITYRFKPKFWVFNTALASTNMSRAQAVAECSANGGGLAKLREITSSKVIYWYSSGGWGDSRWSNFYSVRNPNASSITEVWGKITPDVYPNSEIHLPSSGMNLAGWVDSGETESIYNITSQLLYSVPSDGSGAPPGNEPRGIVARADNGVAIYGPDLGAPDTANLRGFYCSREL